MLKDQTQQAFAGSKDALAKSIFAGVNIPVSKHDGEFVNSFKNNVLEGIRSGRYSNTEAALLDNGFIKLESAASARGDSTHSYYDQKNSIIIKLTDLKWSSMKGLNSGGNAGICLHNNTLILGIEVDNFIDKELRATNYSMLAHEFSHLSEYFDDRAVWCKDHLNMQVRIFMDRFVLKDSGIPISREMICQVPNLDPIADRLRFDQNNFLAMGPESSQSDYHLITELHAFTHNASSDFSAVRDSGNIAIACKKVVCLGVALNDRSLVENAVNAWRAHLIEYGHGYSDHLNKVDTDRVTDLLFASLKQNSTQD